MTAPTNLFFRMLGGIHRRVYLLSGGKLGGRIGKLPVLLLTTTGRKSGRPRTQPLTYTNATNGYAVIASKGAPLNTRSGTSTCVRTQTRR